MSSPHLDQMAYTSWMVPGHASRELITRTLLAAQLITPPQGADDKTR